MHKISGRKCSDPLVDSCKHLSVSQMTAGSRLPRSCHGIFFLSPTFQTHLIYNIFKQAVGPAAGVLQTFSTCH